MSPATRALALCCAALLTTSCTGRYTVRSGYYSPSPRETPAAAPKVALVGALDYPDVLSFGLIVCNQKLTAGRSYLSAVETGLRSIYGGVSRVGSLAEAKGADYAVDVGRLPDDYALRFLEPATGRTVAEFSRPGDDRLRAVMRKRSQGFANATLLLLLPLSLPMCAAIMPSSIKMAGEGFEAHSSAALDELLRSIASDGRVMLSPKDKLRLEELEERGDKALRAGEAREALRLYAQAAALAQGLGSRTRALTIKAARAAGQGEAPPIAEEARRLMARGQAYFKQASSPADYRKAISEMESALALAPWWGAGHFNAGLAHEGAGNWAEAADHLKAYLAASPQAPDSAEIRGKLAELEIHAERGDKAAGAK